MGKREELVDINSRKTVSIGETANIYTLQELEIGLERKTMCIM